MQAVEKPSAESRAPPSAASNVFSAQQSRTPAPSETSKPQANNIFSMQASSSSLFKPQTTQPTASSAASNKRAADEQLTKDSFGSTTPTTEKRSKPSEPIQYPSLPDTASNTAKLFASTLDRPVERANGATSSFNASTPWNAPMSSGSKPSEESNGVSSFGPPQDVMAKVREQKAAKEAAEKSTVDQMPKPAPAATFTPSTLSLIHI